MGTIVRFPRHHARASAGFKKASIGTAPPEISLRRLAKLRDGSFRPAKMLRRCAPEQSEASANCLTDMPLFSAQDSIGCESTMDASIPPGNGSCQPEIFPVETQKPNTAPLQSDMGKLSEEEPPTIYLGDWLEFFEVDVTEAAEVAGCTQGYVSNIIANRKANINVLYLLKLSESIGVTINDFYRPLPKKSELAAFKKLSPKAQAAILDRQQKKG